MCVCVCVCVCEREREREYHLFYKKGIFYAFPAQHVLSEKGSLLKGKNWPFLLVETPFQKGTKPVLAVASPESLYVHLDI